MRFRTPEVILGALLAAAIFGLGYSVSSFDHEPSGPETNHPKNGIDQVVEPFASLWAWATRDSISVYTLLLTVTTAWLAVITLRSVNLAREEFNASHRAKIRLLALRTGEVPDTVCANLTAVNVGDIEAKVESVSHRFVTAAAGKAVEDLKLEEAMRPVDLRLKSGVPHTFTFVSRRELDLMAEIQVRQGHLHGDFRCVGFLQYSDVNGAVRRSGFSFTLARNGAWIPDQNSDYAYEY